MNYVEHIQNISPPFEYFTEFLFAPHPEKSVDRPPSEKIIKTGDYLQVLRQRTKCSQVYRHQIVKQLRLVVLTKFYPLVSWKTLSLSGHIIAKLGRLRISDRMTEYARDQMIKQDGNVLSRRHILGSKIFKEQLLEIFGKIFFQNFFLNFFSKKSIF